MATAEEAVRGAVGVALEALETVAPDDVGKHREAERPEYHEADHHQSDRGGRPSRTDQCRGGHRQPFLVVASNPGGCMFFDMVRRLIRFKTAASGIEQTRANSRFFHRLEAEDDKS